jgi:hypothetical protein
MVLFKRKGMDSIALCVICPVMIGKLFRYTTGGKLVAFDSLLHGKVVIGLLSTQRAILPLSSTILLKEQMDR